MRGSAWTEVRSIIGGIFICRFQGFFISKNQKTDLFFGQTRAECLLLTHAPVLAKALAITAA
jgi:hypothetical protein